MIISTNSIRNVSQSHSLYLPLNLRCISCCKQDDGPPFSDTEEEEESVYPQEPSENQEQVHLRTCFVFMQLVHVPDLFCPGREWSGAGGTSI